MNMNDPNEIRKALVKTLTEEQKRKYTDLVRRWHQFKLPRMSKMEFDREIDELLTTDEQIQKHNAYERALAYGAYTQARQMENEDSRPSFELPEFPEYLLDGDDIPMPAGLEKPQASTELLVPDVAMMRRRVNVAAWENDLDRAENGVANVMVHATQVFIKNIITAMITRKEGYKVKDGKFQHAFGLPVPDPFTQSSRNVVDGYTVDGEQLPPSLVPYEKAESDTVFAYSCAKSKRSDGRLTVRLLYDTLSERPDLLGLHSIHAVSLLKLGLQLDE